MPTAKKTKNYILKLWTQKNKDTKGEFITYEAKNIFDEMSFLEMLDIVNEDFIKQNKKAVEFDNDCREGICGACSLVINGTAHGAEMGTATCQLYMRCFKEGETIFVEPFRAKAFPIIKDLIVDRSAFDRIQQAGAYTSVNTGNAQDANSILIGKKEADKAFDYAACIGCGACVASCKNASASLFVGAKLAQLALLPQGQVEKKERSKRMVAQMDKEQFGSCTNTGVCSAVCPKEISLDVISKMNCAFFKSLL